MKYYYYAARLRIGFKNEWPVLFKSPVAYYMYCDVVKLPGGFSVDILSAPLDPDVVKSSDLIRVSAL